MCVCVYMHKYIHVYIYAYIVTLGVNILFQVCFGLCSSFASEAIVYRSSDLRAAYAAIPTFSFLMFFTSSLILKPSLYPGK